MSKQLRDLLLLFALGVLVNGFIASLTSIPGYTDAYYYFNGGTFIARGQWVEPYLWNFVSAPPSLPAPAFAYWQPLPSLIAALGIWLVPGIAPFDAAQLPYVILAALLPVLTYCVGIHVGERRHGLTAGLLAVFSGYYALYWTTSETYTPYAVTAAGALALAGWGRDERRWWKWLLAGGLAALAHLTRADGVLVIVVLITVSFLLRGNLPIAAKLSDALMVLTGYLAVISPWWLRNLSVFGSIQAPGGLGALWLINYNDLFSYPPQLTPATFFAAGIGPILQTRWEALLGNIARFVGVLNLVFLTPFTLIGAWRHWRHNWLMPAILYGLAMSAAMTFAFSLVGVRGGFIHSAGALIPFAFPAAVLGIDESVGWVAKRRHGWRAAQARKVFGSAAVVLAVLITSYLVGTIIIGLPYNGEPLWNQRDQQYHEIGAYLDQIGVPQDAPVMVNNPPGFYTLTGHGGVPLPNGDEATLLQAADDFNIEYLIINEDVGEPLVPFFLNGPTSTRFTLLKEIDGPIYVYKISQ